MSFIYAPIFTRSFRTSQPVFTRYTPSSGRVANTLHPRYQSSSYSHHLEFGIARAINFTRRPFPIIAKVAGLAGVGLGLTALAQPVYCDPSSRGASPLPPDVASASTTSSTPPPPPPKSTVNVYELTFGTVCGICAGIFVKKGAKAVAFVLGGVFVLLQYLGSMSVVRVNWAKVGSRFENLFYTTDATGVKRPPNVYSLWTWLVDFLTADFQQRASFLAGLALGLRVG